MNRQCDKCGSEMNCNSICPICISERYTKEIKDLQLAENQIRDSYGKIISLFSSLPIPEKGNEYRLHAFGITKYLPKAHLAGAVDIYCVGRSIRSGILESFLPFQ